MRSPAARYAFFDYCFNYWTMALSLQTQLLTTGRSGRWQVVGLRKRPDTEHPDLHAYDGDRQQLSYRTERRVLARVREVSSYSQ